MEQAILLIEETTLDKHSILNNNKKWMQSSLWEMSPFIISNNTINSGDKIIGLKRTSGKSQIGIATLMSDGEVYLVPENGDGFYTDLNKCNKLLYGPEDFTEDQLNKIINGELKTFDRVFVDKKEILVIKNKYDILAEKLQEEFGESIIDEGDEANPYDWWLIDVTVTDIIEFIKKNYNART